MRFFQAKILEWVVISFSRGLSQPRDQTCISSLLHWRFISLLPPGKLACSCHVWMWELDCEEGWVQRTDAFELWCWRRLLRVPWTARRSNQSILKISPGISLEGMMLKLKLQYFSHLILKSWFIGKDSDAGRDWGQEEKGTTEDEMAGWHHWLDGREFEWTLGVGDGQGSLGCCDSWGHKESDTTERLNWTELRWKWSNLKNSSEKV